MSHGHPCRRSSDLHECKTCQSKRFIASFVAPQTIRSGPYFHAYDDTRHEASGHTVRSAVRLYDFAGQGGRGLRNNAWLPAQNPRVRRRRFVKAMRESAFIMHRLEHSSQQTSCRQISGARGSSFNCPMSVGPATRSHSQAIRIRACSFSLTCAWWAAVNIHIHPANKASSFQTHSTAVIGPKHVQMIPKLKTSVTR